MNPEQRVRGASGQQPVGVSRSASSENKNEGRSQGNATEQPVVLHQVERPWDCAPATAVSQPNDRLLRLVQGKDGNDTPYGYLTSFFWGDDAVQMSRTSHTHFMLMHSVTSRRAWHVFVAGLNTFVPVSIRIRREARQLAAPAPKVGRARAAIKSVGQSLRKRMPGKKAAPPKAAASDPLRKDFDDETRVAVIHIFNERQIRDPDVQSAAQARACVSATDAVVALETHHNEGKYLTLADTFARHQAWPQAIGVMDWALKRYPDSVDVHANFSVILQRSGDAENALVYARKACVLSDPPKGNRPSGRAASVAGRALLLRARQLKAANRHDEATELLHEALDTLKRSAVMTGDKVDEWNQGPVIGALAMVHHELGQYEEAERWFRELQNPELKNNRLIEVAAFMGKDSALQLLVDDWFQLDTSFVEYVAHSPFASNLHRAAIWPDFQKSLGVHPDQAWNVFLGQAMPLPPHGMHALPHPASEQSQTQLQYMDNHRRMRDPVVQHAAAARKRTTARQALDAFARDRSNSSAAMDLAEAYAQHQQWLPALTLMQSAQKLTPNNWDVHIRHSNILMEAAEGEEAVLHARRACELETDAQKGIRNSGWVAGTAGRALLLYARQLKVAGRHDDAQEHLQEAFDRLHASDAIASPEESNDWGRGYALGALAMVLEEMRKHEEADQAFAELLELGDLSVGAEEVAAFLRVDWAWDFLQRRWDEDDTRSIGYVVNSPFTSGLHSIPMWPHFAKSLGLHPDQAREILAGIELRMRPLGLDAAQSLAEPEAVALEKQ